MIFIGDLACPYGKVDRFIDAIKRTDIFKDEIVILNLEANILKEDEKKRPITLYNSPDVIEAFGEARKVIVTLANNHMYDYPDSILSTKEYLESKGCGVFGIAETNGTIKPFEYNDGNQKLAFFGHCWRLYTHTNRNTENDVRISDLYYDEFVKTVIAYKTKNPNTSIFCFMHWNYDREKLVMPMHRKIAHDLIDAGVEAVIGSHSHRPQGAEMYNGKPIVYGLGNFYLPSGVYFDGKLSYPDYSKETYALRINDGNSELLWFATDKPDCPIKYIRSEGLDGDKIGELSPFTKMKEDEYKRFFKKNRSKSFLVPLFDDYKGVGYKIKEAMAIARVLVIKKALKIVRR